MLGLICPLSTSFRNILFGPFALSRSNPQKCAQWPFKLYSLLHVKSHELLSHINMALRLITDIDSDKARVVVHS